MKKFALPLIAAALVTMAASAAAEISTVEPVVVTATRLEEKLSTTPAHVTILSEEDIRLSPAETVPEMLRSVPGVLVSDIAGNGRTYNIDLRGFGETGSLNTLVLVDGRRINVADFSGVDWSLIPKNRVARIEIVRGGRGSTLYGDNAAGGIINIITTRGEEELTTNISLSGGSYDTFKGGAAIDGRFHNLSLAVNGSYLESDGYRDNSDTLAKDVGLNLGLDATERLSFSLSSGYHDDKTGMPGRLTDADLAGGVSRTETLFPDDYADTTDWYVQLGSRYKLSESSYLDATLSKRRREADSFNVFFGTDFIGRTDLKIYSADPKLVVDERILGRPVKLLLGVDYEKSEMDAFSGSIFSTSNHELSKENVGYYTHAEIAVTDPLSLSAGVRSDRVEYDFTSIETAITGANKVDEDVFTAGIDYLFKPSSSVYASYAKSFRHPNLDEMFDRYTNTVNIALEPQTSDNYELGLRYSEGAGLNLGINLFHMLTEDEIFYDPLLFANTNLDGDSIRQGVELTAGQTFSGVRLTGSYTFTETEIDGGAYDGNELPFVPRHRATLGIQSPIGERVILGLNGTYVGKRRFISDFDNIDGYLEDYVYVTGRATYQIGSGSIYLAANNILDEEYSEYGTSPTAPKAYYPSPRFNMMAGVEFSF